MTSDNRDNRNVGHQGFVRNTNPVAPENSALADELRRVLKGKPTVSGFNRSLKNEIISFIASVVRIGLVAVLCAAFAGGMCYQSRRDLKADRDFAAWNERVEREAAEAARAMSNQELLNATRRECADPANR